MKKLILASLSGLALLTVAACSDGTDNTTTQSVQPPADEQPMGTGLRRPGESHSARRLPTSRRSTTGCSPNREAHCAGRVRGPRLP